MYVLHQNMINRGCASHIKHPSAEKAFIKRSILLLALSSKSLRVYSSCPRISTEKSLDPLDAISKVTTDPGRKSVGLSHLLNCPPIPIEASSRPPSMVIFSDRRVPSFCWPTAGMYFLYFPMVDGSKGPDNQRMNFDDLWCGNRR